MNKEKSIDYSRYHLFLMISGIYLIFSTLLRAVLWGQFNLEEHSLLGILLSLSIGLLNDIVQLVYLLLPFSFLLLILPKQRSQRHLRFAAGVIFLSLYGLLFLNIVEYYFFDEFDARFNLVAVDYLRYPHEVLINIRESYPVVPLLCFTLLISSLLWFFLWPLMRQHLNSSLLFRQRLTILIIHIALAGVTGWSVSTHSFDFSDNRITNEITANGMSSFFQALRTNQLDYPTYYRTENSKIAFNLLTTELSKDGSQFIHFNEFKRKFPGSPQGLGKLNIVVIVEESLGAEFIGCYGDQRGLTPKLDQLAQQGMFFKHAWATGTRTVRGLEAITLSFPPIPSESVIKRSGSENMVSWGTVMNHLGYHTSFLYGGYGYFDHMNYFYRHNGFAISDRHDIESPKFTNIWGVSDEDLFHHATHYYNHLYTQQHPFFSIVMTTSNHKPYTFPQGIQGIPPQGGGREAGIRYADYALGRFFDEAKQQPWFSDTLFVIVADHGARVYGKAKIPLYSYEIPLLFLSPAHLLPSSIDKHISQIDIAPTVLGLLGLGYEASFFGRDILHLPSEEPSVLLFNHNYTVALAKNNELATLGLQRTASSEHYNPQTHDFTPLKPNESLIQLAIAYYQIAFEQQDLTALLKPKENQ